MSEKEYSDKPRNLVMDVPIEDYFGGKPRFYNNTYQCNVVKVFAGEWVVSDKPDEMLATILGSCVSACIHDPVLKLGGMNHFLLPSCKDSSKMQSDAARYGVNAMESLINAMLKRGARKERLEFKLFGGGNVIANTQKIGSQNAGFVRHYLKEEGYRITREDLEGDLPRSVHFYPTTGKVMVRKLQRREDLIVVKKEAEYQRSLAFKPIAGNMELFSNDTKR